MLVFGVAGTSGSGKTTLIEKLISVYSRQGLRVAAIKHSHHDFEIDREGKDSWRMRRAGARAVVLSSQHRFALVRELAGEAEPDLEAMLAAVAPCDVAIVESFHRGGIPRIEVHRPSLGKPPRWPEDAEILAVASDVELNADRPCFNLDDAEGIAGFMLQHGMRHG